jgi:hypothetical protein
MDWGGVGTTTTTKKERKEELSQGRKEGRKERRQQAEDSIGGWAVRGGLPKGFIVPCLPRNSRIARWMVFLYYFSSCTISHLIDSNSVDT